jgi:hypothetical protein
MYGSAIKQKIAKLSKRTTPRAEKAHWLVAEELYDLVVEEAKDYTRRIFEVCEVFGVHLTEKDRQIEYEKQIVFSLYGQTIQQYKYAVNLAFCKFWKVEPPEGSDILVGLSMFPSKLRQRINILCGYNHRRRFESQVLINTLFMGFKKGLLPARPDFVQNSLNKHAKALQKDPSISDELRDRIERILEEILSQSAPEFKENDSTLSIGPCESSQTRSSTFEFAYAAGGNVAYAQKLHYDREGWLCRELGIGQLVPEFRGFVREEKRFSQPCPVYHIGITRHEMFSVIPRETFKAGKDGEIDHENEFDPSRDDFNEYKGCTRRTARVAPAAVLEPMKVRMITKPSAGLHTYLHRYQKSLWSWLYHHPSGFFALTGEPLRRDHLWPLVSNWQVGDKVVSGDYSQATDNLKGEVSEIILKKIFDPIAFSHTTDYQNVLNSMLSTVICQEKAVLPKYGNAYDNFGYKLQNFVQRNGQLMGNVLSFPILCLANYIAYHISWEIYLGRDISPFGVPPVLINGDDILFKSNKEHYKIWCNVVTEFGFEPSIGKNFFSDEMLQINSVLYRIDSILRDEDVLVNDLVNIPYVNFGLITNRRKQDCTKDLTVQRTGIEGITDQESLLGRARVLSKIRESLLAGLPDDIREVTIRLFNGHSKPILEYFGLSWLDLSSPEAELVLKRVFPLQTYESLDQDRCLIDMAKMFDPNEASFDPSAPRRTQALKRRNPFWLWDFEYLTGVPDHEPRATWVA